MPFELSFQMLLSPSEIVGNLPEITPNYKPLPHLPLDFTSPHKKGIVRNLKFATYLKFATCENTNKVNELW